MAKNARSNQTETEEWTGQQALIVTGMSASFPPPLQRLLPEVSRSFYLTLRVLPGAIRPQIGLAYLLARTTDTIADTDLVPFAERLETLRQLRARIAGSAVRFPLCHAWANSRMVSQERLLLEHCETTITALEHFSPADQRLIRAVLATITTGQELDLVRFAPASASHIIALETTAELEDYTYRVAGCVGEFWTRICRAHLFPHARLDEAWLVAQGIRYGQGLQLVNILRDLPTDLRQGRCYLPMERLASYQLKPSDLLAPQNERPFRPLFQNYLDQAQSWLGAGWEYTRALPRSGVRVRLACAWPILIGLRTLRHLRDGNVLEARHRIKVSRAEVRRIVLHTLAFYPWRSAWNRLPEWYR